ncbi:MAG: response regulator transcription factor [Marinobacterium sp.]|nr:response regulator transcription factor [Marinobacterium sp.]
MIPDSAANTVAISSPHASVLIVEDDASLNELLVRQLQQRNYQVTTCLDGQQALERLSKGSFDLILLDWMLPEVDGIEVLQQLRQQQDTPVIMLTALGGEAERIQGLQCGADDYLTKPFNITELMLRIEGLLRRCGARSAVADSVLSCGELKLCHSRREVSVAAQLLDLTPTEYGLLYLLLARHNQVLSKPELYLELMGRPWTRYDRSLDMHVSKVRKKLTAAGFDARRVQTVHGQGYRLK